MTTKLGRMVTYHEGIPPIKSHVPFLHVFLQGHVTTKIIVSALT